MSACCLYVVPIKLHFHVLHVVPIKLHFHVLHVVPIKLHFQIPCVFPVYSLSDCKFSLCQFT